LSKFPGYSFNSHFFVLSDGLRYHYVDEQYPRNSGGRSVILMVHGNPTWSYMWRNLIMSFRDEYRCVAVDHIGCGLSDKPSEAVYQYTLQRRIDDLVEFVEGRDLRRVTLVGHDWGGVIGVGAALRMPERVDRFVLMNTAAFGEMSCPFRIRLCRVPFLGRFLVQGLNAFSLGTMIMAIAQRRHLPKEVRRAFIAPYDSWSNRLAVYKFIQDIPLSPNHPSYPTIAAIEKDLLSLVSKQMCFIWGMQDWCFSPEFLKRFLQLFPDADVHRLDNAHHLLLEDAPEEVIAAISKFLKKQ
jgi:haloalkane dehalogenase